MQLNLVDLAGSERVHKSNAEGQQVHIMQTCWMRTDFENAEKNVFFSLFLSLSLSISLSILQLFSPSFLSFCLNYFHFLPPFFFATWYSLTIHVFTLNRNETLQNLTFPSISLFQLKEAKHINLSLHYLEAVIIALQQVSYCMRKTYEFFFIILVKRQFSKMH